MRSFRACASILAWVAAAGVISSQPHRLELAVEAPAALAGTATRIEAMDQSRVAGALAHAGLELPGRVRIVLIDRDQPAAQQSPPWVVGTASGTDTMVLYPHRIGAYPYDSLESVVVHELAHLALSAHAGGRALPRWFHEGVAVSVESRWGLETQVRLLMAAARDPRIVDVSALFASDSLPATYTAYLLSAALVDDLRRRHGQTIPARVAARVRLGETFAEAFVQETGETPDVAAAIAWRVYRGLRWLPVITSTSGVWGAILALAAVAFVVRVRRRREQRRRWEAEEREQTDILTPDSPGSAGRN
jgi:MYXO-CTERM domain-containing protein